MNPVCHICGWSSGLLLDKDGYVHYECSKCGLVFVWPLPTEDKLKKEVYSEESGYQAGKTTDDGSLSHLRHTKKILGSVKPGKLLDVGCSSGDFLITARDKGFEVDGIELNPRTAKQAKGRGLAVKIGTLADAYFASGQFDVVHLGDVIEHVPNPRTLIRECTRVLKDGGELVISTPNIDCLLSRATLALFKWFKIPWSTATPPHHLFLFNSINLDMFLKQEGFAKRAKWYERPPRLLYELGNLHLWGKFKRHKSVENATFLIFAFALYSLLYALNFAISLVLTRNFGQVGIYQKQNAQNI